MIRLQLRTINLVREQLDALDWAVVRSLPRTILDAWQEEVRWKSSDKLRVLLLEVFKHGRLHLGAILLDVDHLVLHGLVAQTTHSERSVVKVLHREFQAVDGIADSLSLIRLQLPIYFASPCEQVLGLMC